MKTIKFRAKTKENEWVYGYYVYTYPNEHRIFGKDRTSIDVILDTVGQFTGLTDKNGNEIYEGDIVETEMRKQIAVVSYSKGAFNLNGCPMPIAMTITSFIKVIGNIHDDTDLLTSKNK